MRRPGTLALALLWAGSAAAAEGKVQLRAAPPAPPAAPVVTPAVAAPKALELPIQEVTVFSDRARVLRRGEAALKGGKQRLFIARLPATVDPQSVRLQTTGGSLVQVEVGLAERDAFPRAEAEQLLRELEAAHDREAALQYEREGLQKELALLDQLRPVPQLTPAPEAPPVLLEPQGWRAGLRFFEARASASQARTRELDRALREQQEKTKVLADRALQLTAGTQGQPGYRVDAVLEGSGPVQLTLTYTASAARWYPAYDVRYSPGSAEAELDFAGLVSQQTGEDWQDAKLVLSTAVPATVVSLPKLTSWKIGDRDRFIPTPYARPDPPAPAPSAPVRAPALGESTSEDVLRSALQAAAQGASRPQGVAEAAADYDDAFAAGAAPEAPPPPPMRPSYPKAQTAPQPTSRARHAAPSAAPAPAAMEPPSMAYSGDYAEVASTISREADRSVPTMTLGLAAPGGWRAPSYAADLPASLAGGYDFTYASAKRETVRSGGESRRVALHAARFPAQAHLTILPALRKQAYLVADVVNQSERPLLRGGANLYVGADLQGQAEIATTAVGEKLTLPLGIDDAVRIERQVNLVTKESGFISKDDVSTYEVKIELLNPRLRPVDCRVVDQVPLKGDKHVSIAVDASEPLATQNKEEGTLEWRLQLPPNTKKVISFRYTLTRPRGAQLRQW